MPITDSAQLARAAGSCPLEPHWASTILAIYQFAMKHEVLDTVVLAHDVPEHGLRSGDLGAVVDVYPPDALEVEFVMAAGRTTALVSARQGPLLRGST